MDDTLELYRKPQDYLPPEPFSHQKEGVEKTAHLKGYAFFWEMGCGKTKPTIDTFRELVRKGMCKRLLVIAPNGVHANWITDEFPKHLPGFAQSKFFAFCYFSSKAGNKSHKRQLKQLMQWDGPKALVMSYDAVMTKAGHKAVHDFVSVPHPVMCVLDESGRIKNPATKRTKRVLSLGKYCLYKRILTGTPISNGPFDAYAQIKFLDDRYWVEFGLDSYAAFKAYFGVFMTGYNKAADREFKSLVAYQRLDDLNAMLKPISSRLTKDEVLDLPPKLYKKIGFDMTMAQMAAYQQLKDEFIAVLNSGEVIPAPLVIQRIIKWQQITSGYIATPEAEEPYELLADPNPRMQLLKDVLEDIPHKCIIWAKFQKDIDQIKALLGDSCVTYDGRTGDDDRLHAKSEFQNNPKGPKFFVGNPAACGEGLTLHAARTVVYYNSTYKLQDRLQSEDRAHRIGQEHPVNYIDIVANGTIDEKIVMALVRKKHISDTILGDKVKEWIT